MNVHDFLKDKSEEEIRQYCQSNACEAAIAMVNTGYDYNIAQIIRNANFFGFKEVFHIQKEGRRLDKRGTVGTHHYTPVTHFYDFDSFIEAIKNKYTPVAVENNVDYPSLELMDFGFPSRPVFILGAEGQGLTLDQLNKCWGCVYIEGFGSVRSLNVATTSGIIMSHFRLYKKVMDGVRKRSLA
jgi:tRNA G18 (ribose-2'-O)-methylase SpoU